MDTAQSTAQSSTHGNPSASSGTAATRVFAMSELCEKIGQHLSHHDLANLRLVNRDTHYRLVALTWRHTDLTRHHIDRLIRSPEWVASWSRNCDLIESLSLWNEFAWMLFAASVGDQQHHTQPPWIAPPHPEGFVKLPLRLGTELRHLTWKASSNSQLVEYHPVALYLEQGSPYGRIKISSLIPASWIIHTNPKLVSLDLSLFQCSTPASGRTFIRAISTLRNLKRLKLQQDAIARVPFAFVLRILQCMPASLESVIMDFFTRHDNLGRYEEAAQPSDSDFELDSLTERAGPLLRLMELKLPCLDSIYTRDQVEWLFQECPALERLVVPQYLGHGAGVGFANTIRDYCPSIRHWSFLQPLSTWGSLVVYHITFLQVINNLPAHQVESLLWSAYWEEPAVSFSTQGLDIPSPSSPFLRFSDTLRHLRLVEAVHIRSATIRGILTECAHLRSLAIGDYHKGRSFIELEDAIARPWACISIEQLEISVEAEAVAIESGSQLWARWGAFARQIGQLTELRSLSLRALRQTPEGPTNQTYQFQTLPGLLGLDTRLDSDLTPATDTNGQTDEPVDPAIAAATTASALSAIDIQRTGFLIHLEGLTKLQQLRGSFHTMTCRFFDATADWIRSHWPEFEMLEFYPEDYFSRAEYQEGAVPEAVLRFRNELGYRVHAFPQEEGGIWGD